MQLDERQLRLLDRYLSLPLIHPRDFLRKWSIDYRTLARICCCSLSTVQHWFGEGSTQRQPGRAHQKLLAIANLLLENSETIDIFLMRRRL